jgi:hypothetical protein
MSHVDDFTGVYYFYRCLLFLQVGLQAIIKGKLKFLYKHSDNR